MTRENIGKKAVELSKENNNILLELATGTGKTKVSLAIIDSHKGNWLVVLAERAHLKNWQEDIKKHGYHDLLKNITFVLYASLHKHVKMSYKGVVLDEAHHCTTDIRLNSLKQIKFNKCIALTATITAKEKDKIESIVGPICTFKYSLAKAINSDILPTPKIYLHTLFLDNKTVNSTFILTKGSQKNPVEITTSYKNRFNALASGKNVKVTVNCTECEKYLYLCSKVDYYKNAYLRSYNDGIKNRWLQAATMRKRFLSESKTKSLQSFLPELYSRYICFAGSIEQCSQLGGKNIVHSKKKNNQKTIDNFNSRKINNIFAVGMLREGVNLVDADAVIVQLDSGSRATVQMLGRALRKENPVIHIFYYKDTQDEIYMNNSLEEFKEFVVNI